MAAKWIVFDIETYRTRNPEILEAITLEALNAMPAQNTAKAIKDIWDTPAGRQGRIDEAVSKTACDPLLAEPLVICADAEGSFGGAYECFQAHEIPIVLRTLAQTMRAYCDKDTVWVGHNIERFDLPLLVTWWQRLGIEIPPCFPVALPGGRWRGRVFDTMTRTPTRAGYISADNACRAFGIPCKTVLWQDEPMTGVRVSTAYESGEHDLITRYCNQDVSAEKALFLKITQDARWGLWDRVDSTVEQLREIAESDLSAAQKWLAASPVLQSAGLI